jgi:hypothetical protein
MLYNLAYYKYMTKRETAMTSHIKIKPLLFFAKIEDLKLPEKTRSKSSLLTVIPEKISYDRAYTHALRKRSTQVRYQPSDVTATIPEEDTIPRRRHSL